jgi:hypothetical protein
MTWVVAASTIYGYGALYSDVQVTFRDGTTRDILQKAYTVANFVAGGFAGSVKIGFMLVQSLIDHLTVADTPDDDTYAWDPLAAALSWAPIAPRVFASAEDSEQTLGSRLLLVGASPVENQGLGAKVYFVRFSSPAFEPQIMSRAIKICGIGSGASVREYKHSIKPLFRLTSGLLKAEIGRSGGWGNHLGHSISHTLGQNPRTGISRHLNTILIARQGFRFGTTDQTIHHKDGSKTEHKMPAIAQSYEQFLAMAKASGSEGAGAVC